MFLKFGVKLVNVVRGKFCNMFGLHEQRFTAICLCQKKAVFLKFGYFDSGASFHKFNLLGATPDPLITAIPPTAFTLSIISESLNTTTVSQINAFGKHSNVDFILQTFQEWGKKLKFPPLT